MSTHAGEAAVYWNAAKHFRLKSRLGQDTSDEADDLAAIAMHSDNPVLVRGARALLENAQQRSAM